MIKDIIRPLQAFLALLLLTSLMIVISGIFNELKLSTLENEGRITEGTIIDHGKLDKEDKITHFLTVEFYNHEDVLVSKTLLVDEDDYQNAVLKGAVPITYIPNDPSVVKVGKNYGYSRTPLYIGILLSIASLVGIIQLQLYHKKNKAAVQIKTAS